MGDGGGAVNAPAHGQDPRETAPVLITEAAVSYEQQLAARKKKYFLMMSCRIPCLILAGVLHSTPWLALGILAISIPLPWIAVLVANDRPPRKAEEVNRYQAEPTKLENGSHPVIEGS
ncbi:DUF3099 domain-containing protein [Amycolatopsis sp. H20-H5]|uniref:DUF3099 domain-containing protein n=1 Tax=Amycolatopsis sp. H20-H5 TaxID=3046309 RepID=UPI002DB9EBD4|nr:DUF3099 domain-containing protein [Amycolatopsis sp. H20-H5]MEC3974764.1 DUF3099 domain-containing protein [Amycolatopsis sp. H20-H5]